MAKFGSGHLDHAGFLAIKGKLTADLASRIQEELQSLGDNAKAISWFSSIAESYARSRLKRAA